MFFLISCDPSGSLYLINGYDHKVRIHSIHEYNNSIFDGFSIFEPGEIHGIDGRGHIEFSHIIAIRIETVEGIVLAEYTREYLTSLRKIHIPMKNQHEIWVFTEKGLFLKTDEINRRYRNQEEILEYYRSDEAVQDLKAMLKEDGS
jgi:hypothetical protein